MKWVVLIVGCWWLGNTALESNMKFSDIQAINANLYSIVSIKKLTRPQFVKVTNSSDAVDCPVGYKHVQWCTQNGKVCSDGLEMNITLSFKDEEICCIATYDQAEAVFTIKTKEKCGGQR